MPSYNYTYSTEKREKPKFCRKCYIDVVLLATLQALAPGGAKNKKIKNMERRKNDSYKGNKDF
jgi:hypothetical protein